MLQVMAVDAAHTDVTTAAVPSTSTTASTAASRKKRRRAPTTGAADDCFACQETHNKCDRRRPYCQQCLDRGKTCSGYKTQLTWGMGVASRGKLRGMSLPVAKSKKAIASEKEDRKQASSVAKDEDGDGDWRDIKVETQGIPPASQPASSTVISPTTTFNFVHANPDGTVSTPPPQKAPSPPPPPPKSKFTLKSASKPASKPAPELASQPAAEPEWTPQPPANPPTAGVVPVPPRQRKAPRRHSLQPLQMSTMMSPVEYSQAPMTAGGFGSYRDSRFEQALDDSPLTPSYARTYPPYSIQKQPFQSHHLGSSNGMYMHDYTSTPSTESWHTGSMSSSLASDHSSSRDFFDGAHLSQDPSSSSSLENANDHYFSGMQNSFYLEQPGIKLEPEEYVEDGENVQQEDSRQHNMSLQLTVPTMAIGKTRGLQSLITYYDQVIAPVIVAFDGPTNPYRTHILRLASESEALQHAIAALSASNLRMRKDYEIHMASSAARQAALQDSSNENSHTISVRKSSIAHSMLRDTVEQPDSGLNLGKHSHRELYHKGESIKALNARLSQLRDHSIANDDTVLATLLVLCLYHICDTGVAKFRTQFAGVKKLMALRNKRNSTRESKWLITMFKWFDAMTATVNDREGQFEEDFEDYEEHDSSEWALENLAGVDGRLFKIISKLGRLNILSQGKQVNSGNLTPRAMPPRPPFQGFYGASPAPDSYDGNGWILQGPDSVHDPGASRQRFEVEWFALRQELLDWQFNPATIPPSMFRGNTGHSGPDANTLDLNSISEAFRYSALLYTERLAHPNFPSSYPNFQNLVESAIHHIRAVKSDVYLLWPLFITGTECVNHEHRALIRQRCLDIQSDSGFYNNKSALTLLENIWKDMDEGKQHATMQDGGNAPLPEGPFSWRKAMASEEGEYIVI